MPKKIFLSPSDQKHNAYAYSNTTEDVQCKKIANACQTALERYGFLVKNNQTDNMYGRVIDSDSWGADLHVCIHTNAANGKAAGTRIFTLDTKGEGYKAATAIYNVLAPLTPGTSEGIQPWAELYEIRKTDAPCAYVECDFHDVPEVAKWIVEHTTEIGEAIAKGIADYFGVKTSISEKKNTVYRVQVGSFSNRNNALDFLKTVQKYFSNAYIIESLEDKK